MLYERFDRLWKLWMFLGIAILIFSAAFLGISAATKGYILERDVELRGGKMITAVVGDVDIAEMQKMFPYATVHLTKGATNNLLVEIPFDANETAVVDRL